MAKKRRHTNAAPPKLTETSWQAHSDMHALKAAAEIKADPKRHGAAKEMARTEVHHLKKVAGRKTD